MFVSILALTNVVGQLQIIEGEHYGKQSKQACCPIGNTGSQEKRMKYAVIKTMSDGTTKLVLETSNNKEAQYVTNVLVGRGINAKIKEN